MIHLESWVGTATSYRTMAKNLYHYSLAQMQPVDTIEACDCMNSEFFIVTAEKRSI